MRLNPYLVMDGSETTGWRGTVTGFLLRLVAGAVLIAMFLATLFVLAVLCLF